MGSAPNRIKVMESAGWGGEAERWGLVPLDVLVTLQPRHHLQLVVLL